MSRSISDVLREAYKKRKMALMEEFEALSEQIMRVLSDRDKIRIERELEKIKQDMHLVDRLLRDINEVSEFEPEHAFKLQNQIVQELELPLLLTFGEYVKQIDSYLAQIAILYEMLEEWKELHNVLHDLHYDSLLCRRDAELLEKLAYSTSFRKRQQQVEILLKDAEGNWRACGRKVHLRVKHRAKLIQKTGIPYNENTGNGPYWYLKLAELRENIDGFFRSPDFTRDGLEDLARKLYEFDDVVEDWLLMADDNLRKVAQKINQQRLPGTTGT